ncbi:lactonase family protein [Streptomyces sp. NPDC093065]|uniref:lactonase family protein n=1 Tax=Streptomyces sp. NPDC093065 TaxID=3366021 RepID=UPI00381486E3
MNRDSLNRRRLLALLARTAAAAALPAAAACGGPDRPDGPAAAGTAPGASSGASGRQRQSSGPRPLLVGTYTSAEGGGKGVGLAEYDPGTGRITGRGVLAETDDPSYLAVHPDGRTVYAVNERDEGAVTAVRLSDHRVLGSRSTGGAAPCHLSVHPGGRWLLSADYGSGSVAVHPIDTSGALGERTGLVTHSAPPPGPGQTGPHAHQVVTAPDGKHVLAVDLGTDTVYTYRLDETAGTLAEVSRARTRPGAGPRHLAFHPGGRHAYLANEVDNTVAVCAYDPQTGRLTVGEAQSTGAEPSPGSGANYPAQFLVTSDGAYAFLANRGHNSLSRYAVEAAGARLRLLGTVPAGGDFPRQIAFSPDGGLLFAANQRSGTVSAFRVGEEGGELRPTGEPFASPVAVCALPL